MPDETETPKELTAREKLDKATKEYFAALKAGDKKLAAQIHKDNNLPYSQGTHS